MAELPLRWIIFVFHDKGVDYSKLKAIDFKSCELLNDLCTFSVKGFAGFSTNNGTKNEITSKETATYWENIL